MRTKDIVTEFKPEGIGGALFVVAKDSAIYLVGTLMIGVGNFILVPLYTRYLNPAEFGVYALVDVAILLLVSVSQLKFDVSYLKWFADVDPPRQGKLLGSVIAGAALAGGLTGLALAVAVAKSPGEHWLHTSNRGFAWMLLPLVVLESLQGILFTNLRARRKAVTYSVAVSLRLLVIVGGSVYLIAFVGLGLGGVFLGRLIGDAACVLAVAVDTARRVRLGFDLSLLAPMLRFGAPLLLSTFAVTMQDFSGRYFLSHYATLDQVGVYGAAIKLSGIFQIAITQPFGVAWGGLMFQIVHWPGAKVIYSKILAYVFVVSIAGALVLTCLAPTLFTVLTSPAYMGATAVFPLILFVRLATVMEYPASVGIYLSGRTKWFVLIYLAGLAVNVTGLLLLTPRLGMLGPAWAWLCGSFAVTTLMAIISQRLFRLSFSWNLLLPPALVWGASVLARHGVVRALAELRWQSQLGLALAVIMAAAALLLRDMVDLRKRIGTESIPS